MAAGKPAASVQVEGAAELRKALKHMGNDLKDLRAINLEAAEAVANEAQHRVPRRSGSLAGSIKPKASKAAGWVTAGSRGVVYAGPIHFGWPRHNIAPNPFLYEAMADRRAAVVEKYQNRVSDLVERVERETPP